MSRRRTALILGPLALLLAALLALSAGFALLRGPRFVTTDQFGRVRIYPPWLRERGFVYLLSGADGWSRADDWTARAFAAADNYVVGIDTPRLLIYLNQQAPGCLFMPGLLEDYSRVQERSAATPHDYEPLVLGRGIGASLAYLGQIGAPALALGAVVMLDPEPQLPLKAPICEFPAIQLSNELQQLQPNAFGRNAPARLWLDAQASSASRAFAAQIPGHVAAPAPQALTLRGLYVAGLEDIEAEKQRSGVADLPLVEVPASRPSSSQPNGFSQAASSAFAILYSGDGGWRDLDRSLADLLAARGVNVVGVDVLRYYWRSKQPERAARDLARIIEHYERQWGQRRVVLIGFSFGANVLPFLVNRLPEAMRADIALITLLSPERTTAFEVTPAGWFGKQSDATIPVQPELQRLASMRLQCFYGEDEAQDSLCTTSAAQGHEVIRKPGGHHFDQNYDRLADAIIAAVAGH